MKHFVITIVCVVCAALGILVVAELSTAQEEMPPAPPPPGPDLVERIKSDHNLTTFSSALRASDLEPLLKSRGPFTVFAPDNAAFAKLPAGTLEDLLKPDNKKKLARTIKLHLLGGKHAASNFKAGKYRTEEGGKVRVSSDKGVICYGDAKVIAADIDASNGVLHVIDTVIVPD